MKIPMILCGLSVMSTLGPDFSHFFIALAITHHVVGAFTSVLFRGPWSGRIVAFMDQTRALPGLKNVTQFRGSCVSKHKIKANFILQ